MTKHFKHSIKTKAPVCTAGNKKLEFDDRDECDIFWGNVD
jgi:hypothetical protein